MQTSTAPSVPLLHIPDAYLRDVRRSVSLLVESAPRVTEWGLATILEQLVAFVGRTGASFPFFFFSLCNLALIASAADLPRDVFKHYFFHYLYSNSPVLVHTVVLIMLRFPEIMQIADYRTLVDQLFRLIDEPLLYAISPLVCPSSLASFHALIPESLVVQIGRKANPGDRVAHVAGEAPARCSHLSSDAA